MKSRLTSDFRAAFARLPDAVKIQARKAHRLWRQNPYHPSLHFKRVHEREPLYAVRVSLGWRAVGLWEDNIVTWFWIGSHAEYDKLLRGI